MSSYESRGRTHRQDYYFLVRFCNGFADEVDADTSHWLRSGALFLLQKKVFIFEFLKFNFNAFLLYDLVVLSSPLIDPESPSSSAKPLIYLALFDEVNTIRCRLHTKRDVGLRLCNLWITSGIRTSRGSVAGLVMLLCTNLHAIYLAFYPKNNYAPVIGRQLCLTRLFVTSRRRM